MYSFKGIFPLSVNINAKWGILTSGVIFGLVHLTNYNFSIDTWYLCLPMVLPQIFSGILLGTVRCFYGFSFSVIIHMLLNSLSLFATLV
ncbi:CPBP family glutamic-type intramembrane protease [Dyadobacter jejuensis]|uniref:CPBP family glutamic-type intramembrane protease n=1 Tax=Dyadobacter jejuensis TaxID=1082580 RepID=UPI0035B590C1